jgi:hypothetical protein
MVTIDLTNDEALGLLELLSELYAQPRSFPVDHTMRNKLRMGILQGMGNGPVLIKQAFMPDNIAVEDMPALCLEEERLLCSNNAIGAIKAYRARTGAALKQAKDKIDSARGR